MHLTIGKLARKYQLSRSTLLYYDSIGLLCPSGHQKGEYRIYSEEDERRLDQICSYRHAGICLKDIKEILESPETHLSTILQQRFYDVSAEIGKLLEQQRVIAGLLKNPELLQQSQVMSKELWTSLLKRAGFSDKDMVRWHIHFERMDPEKHLIFLEHLQIPEKEIQEIRNWAHKKI